MRKSIGRWSRGLTPKCSEPSVVTAQKWRLASTSDTLLSNRPHRSDTATLGPAPPTERRERLPQFRKKR